MNTTTMMREIHKMISDIYGVWDDLPDNHKLVLDIHNDIRKIRKKIKESVIE